MTKPLDKNWRSMVSEVDVAGTEMEMLSLRSTEVKIALIFNN